MNTHAPFVVSVLSSKAPYASGLNAPVLVGPSEMHQGDGGLQPLLVMDVIQYRKYHVETKQRLIKEVFKAWTCINSP